MGYKLAVVPVAGALLGGVLGGPLGLLAGFKAAGVAAAIGGGALGFAGGNLVQRHRKAQVEQQMKKLTATPPKPPTEQELPKEKWADMATLDPDHWLLTEGPVWTDQSCLM